MNYETARVDIFGASEGLADVLRFPVFLSSLTEDALTVLKRTYSQLPKRVTSRSRALMPASPTRFAEITATTSASC
jgi:hypothetical protein